jgi:hypothetical protein
VIGLQMNKLKNPWRDVNLFLPFCLPNSSKLFLSFKGLVIAQILNEKVQSPLNEFATHRFIEGNGLEYSFSFLRFL